MIMIFFFNGKKVDFNLTVEQNRINQNNCLIFVKKKSSDSYENNIIEQNQNNNYINNEFKDKFEHNENFKYNPMENDHKINLLFQHSKGQIFNIVISPNATFKTAVKKFCDKVHLPFSDLTKNKNKIFFLYNASKLDIEDSSTLAQIGLRDFSSILVNDNINIIGA